MFSFLKEKKSNKKKSSKKNLKVSENPLPPFFGRVGGKFRLRDLIANAIPLDSKIYVEAFVGGGSVYLYKRRFEKEVINDLDKDIYYMWKDMKDCGYKMKNRQFIPKRAKFDRYLKQKNISNCVNRLYRNLYISFFSYSQMRTAYIGENAEKSPRFNRPTNGQKMKNNIDGYREKLKRTKIENKDYKKIIKNYDSPETFFYLDPPYTDAKEYKHNDVNPEDLAELLKNIKGKFLLSYDYSPTITKVFKNKKYGFKTRTVKTKYKISGNFQEITEILISNYKFTTKGSTYKYNNVGITGGVKGKK